MECCLKEECPSYRTSDTCTSGVLSLFGFFQPAPQALTHSLSPSLKTYPVRTVSIFFSEFLKNVWSLNKFTFLLVLALSRWYFSTKF